MSIRLTQPEKFRRIQAQKILKNPDSTPEQCTAARQMIEEAFRSAQARHDERRLKKKLGHSPLRKDYTPFKEYEGALLNWQRELDGIQSTRILSVRNANCT